MYVLGRPTAYHHTGDEAVCSTWLPFARKKLESLFKRTPMMCRRQTFPLDGVDITIMAAHNVGKIIIDATSGVYLESGFYNILSIAPLNEACWRPPLLVYGAEETADYSPPRPIQGYLTIDNVTGLPVGANVTPKLADGRTSVAMNLGKPLSKTAPNGFTSDTPVYSTDSGMVYAKLVQSNIVPSNYCGLTRIFVQAMYGSKAGRKRYSLDLTGTVPALSLVPKLNADGSGDAEVLLRFYGVDAPWVVCKDWKYWLVTVGYGTATVRKIQTALKHSPGGSFSDLETRQIHAALLADSQLTQTVYTFSCTAVIGDPFAYGWKTNLDGTEAQIVAQYEAAHVFTANHYIASVSFDVAGIPTGVGISLKETADWNPSMSPTTLHALWVPDYYTGRAYAIADLKKVWAAQLCDAPLYAVENGGAVDVVRIKCTGIVAGTGFSLPQGGYTGAGVDALTTTPFHMDSNYQYTYPPTFTYPGATEVLWDILANPPNPAVSGAAGYGSTPYYYKAGSYSDAAYLADVTGWNYYGIYWQTPAYEDRIAIGGPGDIYQSVTLTIPFDDCNAVLYGLISNIDYADMWHYHSDVGYSCWTRLLLCKSDGHGGYETSELVHGPEDIHATAGPGTTAHTRNSQTSTVNIFDAVVRGTSVTITPGSTEYFYPSYNTDPTMNPSYVRSSTGASYKYQLAHLETGASDWPTGTTDPVGWA